MKGLFCVVPTQSVERVAAFGFAQDDPLALHSADENGPSAKSASVDASVAPVVPTSALFEDHLSMTEFKAALGAVRARGGHSAAASPPSAHGPTGRATAAPGGPDLRGSDPGGVAWGVASRAPSVPMPLAMSRYSTLEGCRPAPTSVDAYFAAGASAADACSAAGASAASGGGYLALCRAIVSPEDVEAAKVRGAGRQRYFQF